VTAAVEHGLRPVGINASLIADHLETDNPFLQRRIVQIGYARLNDIV